ncbi:MAG: PTS glucose transporter subunit IIA [Bacillota bacterium]
MIRLIVNADDFGLTGRPVRRASGRVFPGGHALAIVGPGGVEVIVHVGLDTVELKGAGFKTLARQGKEVRAGEDVLLTVWDFLVGARVLARTTGKLSSGANTRSTYQHLLTALWTTPPSGRVWRLETRVPTAFEGPQEPTPGGRAGFCRLAAKKGN